MPALVDSFQMDVLSALLRLAQVDREEAPDGFLWHRVMTCDVPRLVKHLTPETTAWFRQNMPDTDPLDQWLPKEAFEPLPTATDWPSRTC